MPLDENDVMELTEWLCDFGSAVIKWSKRMKNKNKMLQRNPFVLKVEIETLAKTITEKIHKQAKLNYEWACCVWVNEHGVFNVIENDYKTEIDSLSAEILQDERTLIHLQEELKELGEEEGREDG